MSWLWLAGPALFVVVATLNAVWPTVEERRLRREIVRWLEQFLSRIPNRQEDAPKTRRTKRLPREFSALVDGWEFGSRIADIVLVPKRAYVAIRGANGVEDSNMAAVLMRMKSKKGPSFRCQPLPFVDGEPGPNRGSIQLQDEELMEVYQIDSVADRPKPTNKAVSKWLTEDLREMLLDNPELWLEVNGPIVSLTKFGQFDAEELDRLVDAADQVYVEHGASDHSLFGDGDPPGEGSLETKETLDLKAAPRASVRVMAGSFDAALVVLSMVIVAAVAGTFAGFHPRQIFNSPDPVVTEAWQGGWTTKGVGALVAAESLFVGLVAAHAWLVAGYGRSLGKGLFGGKVVDEDGNAPGFIRGVVLRYWVFALAPIAAAYATAPQKTIRGFFYNLPTALPLGVGLLVAVVLIASPAMMGGSGLQDRLSKTRVIAAPPYAVRRSSVMPDTTVVGRVLSASILASIAALPPIIFGLATGTSSFAAAPLFVLWIGLVVLRFTFRVGRAIGPKGAK